MPASCRSDVTGLLQAWCKGDVDALERLVPIVYQELRRLAHRHIRREWGAETLQTTALVHEAYLRLVDGTGVQWKSRAHFFAVCARLMRRILVDRARARGSKKRGAHARQADFPDWILVQPARDAEILALDEALTRLAVDDPRRTQVVELRYFGGLTVEETAAVLRTSPETVARDWRVARLWLLQQLRGSDQGASA